MSSISVTASTTGYTVQVSGGPANPADWVGLYLVGGAQNQWIDWKYLSNARSLPATGLASATLTFPAQTAGQYECRFMENNSFRVLATAAVAAAPPAPASGGIPGYFNVMDYGATGSPSGNDTKALKLARDAALKTATSWGSKGLLIPPGAACISTERIDFRGISHIKFEGWLNFWGPVKDGPCFQFGTPSANGGGKYEFNGLTSLTVPYDKMRHSLLQLMGLRGGAKVEIGSCNFVEIAAEPGAYESTAYSRIFLGSTQRLELRSPTLPGNSTSGWINSNQFYGGAMSQIRIGGPWIDVVSIVGNRVTTATPHNLASGHLVEMYNGTIADVAFRLIIVIDATRFDLVGAPISANLGNGWRCMGPSGYPHNDNELWCPNIEDSHAIVHIQGQCNRLERCRMEAHGDIVFGPHTFMNSVEASNTDHGHPPAPGDFDMTVLDFSNGKNYAGWVRVPKPWGQN